MKKILVVLALGLTTLMAQADDVKIYFLPLKGGKNIEATFAQNAVGGYVCKGISKELPMFLNEPIEFSCDGTKESFESFVAKDLQGKYIGSNFVYEKTSLRHDRGWYVPAQEMKGVVIYYYK